MPAHYNLPSFLRQLSRDLLTDLLVRHQIDLGLDLKGLKKRDIEPIVAAVNRLPDEQRQVVDPAFRNIQALATEAGLRQVIDEARYCGLDIIESLEPHDSFLDKIAWVYLHQRPLFEGASRLAVRDTLPGRYWKRRLPLEARPGTDLGGAVTTLESAIRSYFTAEEGRGRACQVDYIRRDALHHFFAYPEDFPAAPLAWTAHGLDTHSFRPAFEVVFVYDSVLGCLDIYCEGDPRAIKRLRAVFAEAVLRIRDLPEVTKPAYALEGLRTGGFQFIRSPDSAIIDVRVKRLAFGVAGRPTKIAVETDVSEDPKAIDAEVARVFSTGAPEASRIALSQTKVISATLTAAIDLRDGTRPRTRTFDVTTKSCALKYEGNDLLLRKMLADSGIDLAAGVVTPYGESARPAA